MKIVLLSLFISSFSWAAAAPPPLEKLKLPPGFKIEVWAKVPGARSLAQAPDGRIFVGSRNGSEVYVVQKGKVSIFAKGLQTPNGVAIKDNKLYVAEVSRILEFDLAKAQKLPMVPTRVLSQTFPTDMHHGWKFIRFGPDGKLYVPVGANCNICDPGTEYARIYRIDVNGTSKEVVAQGVRNTVGFDFNPETKTLWFTENGRDMMGDDKPPCEVNKLTKVGENFGFPFCHGKDIPDDKFTAKKCSEFTPPQAELRAHVAPLGMRFYTGKMFPAEYKNAIIFAEHGSWNRSIPQGYRLSILKVKDDKAAGTADAFVDGWLQGNDKNAEAWGRPVDVEVMPDGSLLISDDKADVIYRLSYKAEGKKGP